MGSERAWIERSRSSPIEVDISAMSAWMQQGMVGRV